MRLTRHLGILPILIGVVPAMTLAVSGKAQSPQLAGYKALRVHYGPWNQMIAKVNINGHPANLIVDTGANQTILDADAAESYDVRPSQRSESLGRKPSLDSMAYIGMTSINGQALPLAFVRSLTAGNTNFGSSVVVLLAPGAHSSFSNRWANGELRVDGALGSNILVRHKAVLNCRTEYIFFKTDPSRPSHLVSSAAAAKFARVPLRQEDNGAFTVPCSIHGHGGRLVVDTGGFVTTFHEAEIKSLGIALQPIHASANFSTGDKRPISIGQFNDFTIGDFKVPPAKFGVAMLPYFVLAQGSTRSIGILGMDFLYKFRAIIDFDSMSLFLK
jgi:predicted aspartyl protease